MQSRVPFATSEFGEIAQLVEHCTENAGVPGSSPGFAIPAGLVHLLFHPAFKRSARNLYINRFMVSLVESAQLMPPKG